MLAPGRSATWGNLGEAYAALGDESSAIAAFRLAYLYSRNREKTITYLRQLNDKPGASATLVSAANAARSAPMVSAVGSRVAAGAVASAAADTSSDVEKFVKRVDSVATAKRELRKAFDALDECSVGSCYNAATISICELVGALDVNTNGAIVREMSIGEAVTSISGPDVRMMKDLYSQCRPTNYQYWNFDSVFHVGYRPTDQADAAIRKYLGVKAKPRE